jgi:hypothetical protein
MAIKTCNKDGNKDMAIKTYNKDMAIKTCNKDSNKDMAI